MSSIPYLKKNELMGKILAKANPKHSKSSMQSNIRIIDAVCQAQKNQDEKKNLISFINKSAKTFMD